jgi:hypothetical protein
MSAAKKKPGRRGSAAMTPAKKKRDGDSISFGELLRQLQDERGSQNARAKARMRARIKALMALPRGTIAEAESRLTEIEDIQQLLIQIEQTRQGGRSERPATAHIRQLAVAHPNLKPAALYELRDKSIVKAMSKDSWRTRVAEARRK